MTVPRRLRLAAALLAPSVLGVVGLCGTSLATTTTAGAAATTTTSTSTTHVACLTAPSGATTTTSLPTGTTLPTTAAALPAAWTEVGSPDVVDPATASAAAGELLVSPPAVLGTRFGQPPKPGRVGACPPGRPGHLWLWRGPLGPMLAESLFLTRQTHFPAYFLAQAVARIPATSSQGGLMTLVSNGRQPRRPGRLSWTANNSS